MSRDIILARRARFIAAALATITAGACSDSSAQACLAPVGGAGGVSPDGSVDSGGDADSAGVIGGYGGSAASDSGAAGAGGQAGAGGAQEDAGND